MHGWRKVFVIGKDVTGRWCRVAQVSVPSFYSYDQALSYVRAMKNTVNGQVVRPYENTPRIEQ